MWLSFALRRLTLAASRFPVPPTPLPLPVRCCKDVPLRSHSKILLMVTYVEEVLFCILPRRAIREVDVDESVHSCELCCEEVDEVFLEEVNSNGVLNIAVRYHNLANVGHTAVCMIVPMKGLCLILHEKRVIFCKVSDNKKFAWLKCFTIVS